MHSSRVLLLVVLLLTGCAVEPPLSTRPHPPVTLAGIAADHVGPFALAQMPTASWAALEARPPFKNMSHGGRVAFANFAEPSPVASIAYLTDRRINKDSWSGATLRCTVVNLRSREGSEDAMLRELAAAGLAPRRFVGVDSEDYLVATTDQPRWWIRFRDGQVRALVREIDEPLVEVLKILDGDALRALGKSTNKWQRQRFLAALAAGHQPGLAPAAEWNAKVAAIEAEIFQPRFDRHRKTVARVDQTMKNARLLARLPAFADMAKVLSSAKFADQVIPPAKAWHDRHYQAMLREVRHALAGEPGRVVGAAVSAVRSAAGLDELARGHKPSDSERENIEYCLKFAAIRDVDPLDEVARRLTWKPRPYLRAPTFHPGFALSAIQRAATRVRATDGEPAAGSFAAELQEWLDKPAKPRRQKHDRWAASFRAAAAARRLLRTTFPDVATACQVLEQNGGYFASLPWRLQVPLRRELAERLRAAASADNDTIDAAIGNALAHALETDEPLAETTRRARELRRAVRALDPGAKLGDRLVALDDLAGRSADLGPAAEALASQLSLPSGREVAQKAAATAKRGDRAHAAFLYLRAATVGTRVTPEPVSSWLAERRWRLLRQATQSGKASGLPPREEWLIRARGLALAASLATLPAVAPNAPTYGLQDRYVRSQLAGTARLSTHFGVTLRGMSDVRRGRRKGGDVHLVKTADAIRWQSVAARGTAVDLAPYKIDVGGWTKLRKMRAELDRVQAELQAARAVGSSTPADLRAKDRSIIERANSLTASMQQGEVDPEAARRQIDALKRESNALQATINNYNRRTQHINSLVDTYNRQIGPHNELLRSLLDGLATAYGKLLRPATAAWVKAQTKSKKTDNERGIQRWMLGVRDAPELDGMLPSPHPFAIRDQVRNMSDPASAASRLLGELRSREKHPRLWRNVQLEEHLRRLQPAFVAYGEQYGTDVLFDRVMTRLPESRHRQIASFFKGTRRAALNKRLKAR